MTPPHEGTFQPQSTPAAHEGRRRQLLFLGEPLAPTPNLAVRSGLGSTPFAARRIPVASHHCCYIARQFTRQTVRRWNLHSICDDAVQIASELVANAVRYQTRPQPTVSKLGYGWLSLCVRAPCCVSYAIPANSAPDSPLLSHWPNATADCPS
ncbi:hypothetical protein [Streptomyces sp. JCM 35825]|uniref:hypothetical protein n=1 Tax=Streptomyces sp. JCM 35825 TaxID=2930259 RepID=UPI00234A7BA9|nr:hypothetical protein [Streptomyces sp. JCM 35825]WCL89605.1 hypothetical protein PPN52_36240 [Streptomyces sp. JCM 35825]